MTILRPAIFLFLLLTFPFLHAETLTGRVVRVTDGDTIVVLDADKVQHKIRLQGIDAPERKQAFGTKSKEHLSDLLAGKTVEVDYSKYDRYGRVLGKVIGERRGRQPGAGRGRHGVALQVLPEGAISLGPREVFRCGARGQEKEARSLA